MKHARNFASALSTATVLAFAAYASCATLGGNVFANTPAAEPAATAAGAAVAAKPVAPTREEVLARGQQIAGAVCVACHGLDGNSPIPANPMIAAHPQQYIAAQLALYKDGKRKNAVMQGMAANLTTDDMKALGLYYSTQKAAPKGVARDKDLADKGQKIYRAGIAQSKVPSCAGCHGGAGAGIPAQYPRVAGQYPDYLLEQLQRYASGERKNIQMQAIASRMREGEMQAVAEYMAGMRPAK
jgi:cytochrome c553